MHVLVVEEEHASQALAYMKAQKPAQYAERDLTDYELYSMIAGRRVRDICRRDMLSAHFAWVLFGYSLQYVPPRLARLLVFLVMGVRIKLIDPLRRGWHSARGTDA
jgi:hypothetical protein